MIFEVVFNSFTVQTYFYVVRRISCTNAVHIASRSRNFVFKFNDPPLRKNLYVDDTGLGPKLKPFVLAGFGTVFPHLRDILNFVVPLLVVFYFFERSKRSRVKLEPLRWQERQNVLSKCDEGQLLATVGNHITRWPRQE